jgi:hypothetical protein
MPWKLINIIVSPIMNKKLRAIFRDPEGHIKQVDFGAKGMSDYTIHKDTERRERYRVRHSKDLKTNDPTRPGYLSYYILWGDSTDINKNIRDYRKLFNL